MKNPSRREVLKIASLAVPSVAAHQLFRKTSVPTGEVLTYGLFFDEEDVPRIRSLFFNEEIFSTVRSEFEEIDLEAELASFAEVEYNDQLGQVLRLSRLAERTAFLYLMSSREQSAIVSMGAIRELMKFDRWDIYMDGAESIGVQRSPEATLGILTAIDWLGNAVSSEERKGWIDKVAQRGCEPCYRALYDMDNPQQVAGWIFDPESSFVVARPDDQHDLNRRAEIISDTNLRALPTAAVIVGAVAYRNEFGKDSDSSRWLDIGIQSVNAFRDFFGADGSWDEEVQYANYTAENLTKAALALVRAGGANLLNTINWKGYATFLQNMSMPTTDDPYSVVNFGDSGNRAGNPHSVERAGLPVWIASQLGDKEIQWFATTYAGRHTHWSVISFDPQLSAQTPPDAPHLWISSFDRVVARNGWGPKSLVVAMRSGPPANHEHADRNGIIVKSFGQILVADPLRPPYSYADPAWAMRLTQGHSAVLIDGKGHEHHNGVEGTNASTSYARMTTHELTKSYANWTSIATQPYRLVDLQIRDVVRSIVVLFETNVVLVIDRMSRFSGESTLTARFFGDNGDGTNADLVDVQSFSRVRPGSMLRASVFSDREFSVEEGKPFVPEETARKHPFIDVVTEAAGDVLLVTALALAETEAQLTPIQMIRTTSGFDSEIGNVQVRITADSVQVQ